VLILCDDLKHELMQPDKNQVELPAGACKEHLPIPLEVTVPALGVYIRLHRRQGSERVLEEDEFCKWIQRLRELRARAGLQGPIFFLWGTDHQDQPMVNAQRLRSKNASMFLDWKAHLESQSRSKKSGSLLSFFSSSASTAKQPQAPNAQPTAQQAPALPHHSNSAQACATPPCPLNGEACSEEQRSEGRVSTPRTATRAGAEEAPPLQHAAKRNRELAGQHQGQCDLQPGPDRSQAGEEETQGKLEETQGKLVKQPRLSLSLSEQRAKELSDRERASPNRPRVPQARAHKSPATARGKGASSGGSKPISSFFTKS